MQFRALGGHERISVRPLSSPESSRPKNSFEFESSKRRRTSQIYWSQLYTNCVRVDIALGVRRGALICIETDDPCGLRLSEAALSVALSLSNSHQRDTK